MHWIKFACDLTGCQWMTLWLCVLIQIPISVCWNETLSSLFSTTYHFNVTDKILLLTTVSSFIPFPLSRCRSVSDSLLPYQYHWYYCKRYSQTSLIKCQVLATYAGCQAILGFLLYLLAVAAIFNQCLRKKITFNKICYVNRGTWPAHSPSFIRH